jgi:tetratricopeptide (TPR) repeat protein
VFRLPLIRAVAVLLCASLASSPASAAGAPTRVILTSGKGSAPALPSVGLPGLSVLPTNSLSVPTLSPLSIANAPTLAESGPVPTARAAASPSVSVSFLQAPSAVAFKAPSAAPAQTAAQPSPLSILTETAASLPAASEGPRASAEPKLSLDAAFDSSVRRADSAGPVAGAWSGLKRWTRAAVLGAALTLSAGAPALAQDAPAVPAPLSHVFAQAAAPARPQPAAAPGVTVAARPQAEDFALADPIRVDVLVRNDGTQAVVIPADELLEGLRRQAGQGFTVSLPGHHGGGILVQPGTTARVVVELETVGLPQSLQPGKSIPVRIGQVSAASETGSLTVPGFEFRLRSSHPEKDPPQGLYAPSPWSERYYWDWLIAGIWALTGGAAYGLWRLYKEWKRRRLLALPIPPAAPDPGEVAREALSALEAELAAGLPAEEAYRRLVIIVNYLTARLYGLDHEYSEDLSSAARTLRALIERVDLPQAAAAPAAAGRETNAQKRRRLVEETLAADTELIGLTVRHWQRVLEPFDRAASGGDKGAAKRAAGMRRRMGRHLAGLHERHALLEAELRGLLAAERPGLEKTLARRLEELKKAGAAYGEKLEKPRTGPLPGAAREALESLADAVSTVLYAGAGDARPAADLARARGLVDLLAPRKTLPGALGAAGAAGFAVFGVTFGSPLWLLALGPIALLLAWKAWRGRKGPPAVAAPSSALLQGTSLTRRALGWVPRALQVAALVVAVAGLADPQWGYKRGQSVVTSLDNVLVVDRSGSMFEPLEGARGQTKYQAAAEAARQFVGKQRGTTNRAGLILFSDDARLVMSLTLDYDALLAGFGQSSDGGGTDIPRGVEAAIQHFVEMGIVDLDARNVPGAAAVREALKTRGLAAALEEAAKHPRVLSALTSTERHRAIVFLSDGVGGDPAQAVRRARDLGIHIFAIGVPGGADRATLEMMARETGGRFFWVNDKDALDAAFAEIDRLEKAWVNVVSPPRPIHHDHEFAYAALLLLLASLAAQAGPLRLGRIPSRTLFAVLPLTVLMTLNQAGNVDLNRLMNPPPQEQTEARRSPLDLLPYREVPEIRDGVRLLEQGQPQKALERLDEAARAHPGHPEVDLFRSMAQRRLKLADAADRSLERAVAQARAQGRADVLAAAQLELGNAAAQRGDRAAALRHYRNALRVPDASGSQQSRLQTLREQARVNYETLLRQPPGGGQGEQGQGQPQQGQGQPQQGQGQPQQGQGQPQEGQGQPQEGQGQPQQGPSQGNGQSVPQPGQQGQQGQGQGQNQGQGQEQGGQPKPGEGPPQNGQARPGEGKPQPGGRPQQGQGETPAERALREIQKQNGQGGGEGRGERGRLYAAAPLALLGLADLGSLNVIWHNADVLLWTAGAALALGFLLYRRLRGHHKAVSAVAPAATPKSALAWMPGRAFLRKTVLALAAAAMLAAGAAGPSLGTKEDQFTLGGKDVVVLQDVSLSVLWAEDGRFRESTEGLEQFLKWLENGAATDRVAVVPFAGTAGEAVLSDDYRNALFQLYHLGQDALYLSEGSDLGRGLYGAVRTFADARDIGERQRVLIVVSDGGEQESRYFHEALELAKRLNVTIYAIGVGTDPNARLRVPPEDRARLGEYVAGANAGIETSLMRRMAEETGGLYLSAGGEQSMQQVLARIADHSKQRSTSQANVENSVARVFLAPAALLLLLALLAGDGVGRAPKTPKRKEDEPKTLSGLSALPLALSVPALLGPAAGLWPAVAAGAAALVLLLLAAWLTWTPKAKEAPAKDPAGRRADVERAASSLHWDKLLKGEFRSPEAVRFGADPDDAVPHTDEPWRQVDHRASARTGVLHARRFEEDPDIPLMLVVDVSRSGLQGSTGLSKRDVAADIAAAMAIAGAREDMNVGAILFSGRVERVIPPRRGLAHARRLYAAIRDFEPRAQDTDIASGLREAVARAPKRGVVAVLSDFDGDGYQGALAAAGRRHVLVPVVLQDALEAAVPKGVSGVEIEDPETGERGVLSTTGSSREAISSELRSRRRRLDSALGGASARPLYVSNDGGHLNRLVAYFRNGGRIDEPK